jgi:hypothetical protein
MRSKAEAETDTEAAKLGLPSSWDWHKLGQVLKEHGLEIPLPYFMGLR